MIKQQSHQQLSLLKIAPLYVIQVIRRQVYLFSIYCLDRLSIFPKRMKSHCAVVQQLSQLETVTYCTVDFHHLPLLRQIVV